MDNSVFDIIGALQNGEDIKCIIYLGNSEYRFDIKSGNFNDVFKDIDIWGAEHTESIQKEQEAKKNSIDENNTITMGTYEQDADESNGKEAIEWIVLEKQGSRKLLISKYALDCQPYTIVKTNNGYKKWYNEDKYNTEDIDITWEDSSVRDWLNNEFFNEAFSQEEQKHISISTVENEQVKLTDRWNSVGGNTTEDKVFLLSYEEYMSFFNGEETCIPSVYATSRPDAGELWENNDCIWWLRSSGMTQNTAIIINRGGTISGTVSGMNYVRPAIWVNE